VPSLFPYLKHYTDERGVSGEYVLTGSQQFLLLEKITQSLAGRVGLLQLLPLSLSELKSVDLSPPSPENAIIMGGYPRIYDKKIEPSDFYPAYIRSYVERDVRQITAIKDLRLFRQFLSACAGRIGQLVNFSDLSNVLGIDSKTVKSWIGILEASYVVYILPAYHRNFDKRIVKSPKLYFYDTGLACTLLNIRSEDQLDAHFAKGALFGNMVIAELLKQTLHAGQTPAFFFHQDSNAREIDLLIEDGARIKAIEIKAGKTFNSAFVKNLRAFAAVAGTDQTDLYVVYGGPESQNRTDFRLVPWDETGEVLL
jgi:predicted AAA+ superfamily ATPase